MREGSGKAAMIACWMTLGVHGAAPSDATIILSNEPRAASEDEWARLVQLLEVLSTAGRDEKLAALDSAKDVLWLLDRPPRGDAQRTRELLDGLRGWIRIEEDAWVVDRVAAELADTMIDDLDPVFLDLLDHSAPSVRFRALGVVSRGDPTDEPKRLAALERMWSIEQTAWVRARLLSTLDRWGSTVHVAACTNLMWHPDVELALAAIFSAAREPTSVALAALVRRASVGDPALRVAALGALRWGGLQQLASFLPTLERMATTRIDPWIEASLLELLDAAGSAWVVDRARSRLWDSSDDVTAAAIRILARHPTPENVSLLVRRARKGPDDLRVDAIGALASRVTIVGAKDLWTDLLEPEQPRLVRLAVVQALGSLGATEERWVVQDLSDVAEDDPDGEVRREARRTLEPTEGIVACGFDAPPRAGNVVVSPEGAASVRCYDGPGMEPPVERARRLPTGLVVGEYDRFDDGQLWILVASAESKRCWLSADRIRWERPEDASTAPPSSTSEFDMPLEATHSESFVALEDHGIVETFDRGVTLVGVRLTVDAADDEALAVLRGADEWTDTPLGAAVRAFLPASVPAPTPD